MSMSVDACCRGGHGLTVEGLLERLLPTIPAVAGVQTVPLRSARGRVLAETLRADRPVPDFARSAVDGYALRAEDTDLATDLILPVRGRIAAGDSADALTAGCGAIRIYTGAPVPAGYDRVIMQEDCRETLGAVHVCRVPCPGANIRPVGDDLPAGAVALAAGTLLDARHLGVAASLGRTVLLVRRRPRVAVLSTGSELVPPGEPLRTGCICASNGLVISAVLEQAGFEVLDLGVAVDDPGTIDAALRAAATADALVTSGGVSVGDEDHVRGAVERVGGRIEHWRLAIKPGKPVAVGRIPAKDGGETLFVGLPGNPNAAFATLALIGLPLLRARAGQPHRTVHPVMVRVAGGWRRSPGRTEYVCASLLPDEAGGPSVACRLGTGGSAQQGALADSDALLVVPADRTEVRAGDLLSAYPIAALF